MGNLRFLSTISIVASFLLIFALFPVATRCSGNIARSSHHERQSGLEGRSLDLFGSKLLAAADEGQKCDADTPCSNGACCGKTGVCGFGPTFCGDGCQSNCDAHSECGEFAADPGKECPLNVCCSEFGYCGTTEKFCNDKCQSNCGSPDVPPGGSSKSVRNKVIGYYESWAARRPCKKFSPSDIPVSGLTHVNFAFAFVEPDTYEVVPMDGETPASLFKQVTALKDRSSGGDLEVYIAIGGWTFSDNGTDTQPLFGEIAADEDKRQKFADNLVTFMTKYGFDGVDLDWEYPGAPDRGGKERDIKNFVSLMKTLRETFDDSPRGGYGLTFTIPSSYWYMQYFDVPGLLKYADWTNIMSYDLHGVWDANNEIGNIVHGHTNLTEIKLAADLLWRNKVPPGKVVLGTGFYGRTFQLSGKDCAKPGCKFEGPAKAGDCTGEGGILGYFEIQEILKGDDKIEHIHDKEDAVNYFTFDGDQWVSYDDRKTFRQKVDWANDVGLGGLMIWAVDMDDDSYTALSGLLDRDVGESVDLDGSLGNIGLVIDNWSSQNGQGCVMRGCGEKCSSAETEAGRATDDCDDDEHRKICCPIGNIPSECQWRGGDRGLTCQPECRPGELGLFQSEYGSFDCLYGEQQFCCTSEDYEDLVGSCEVTDCGKTSCPSGKTEISSFIDFGGDCEGPGPDKMKRSVCCDEDNKLDGCQWTKCHNNQCNANEVLVMKSKVSNIFCRAEESRLCCKVSDDSAFLPIAPEKIFPELPPDDYDYEVHDDSLDSSTDAHTSPESMGYVVLSGPPDVVSNLDKRDGSHMTFLSCDSIDEHGLQSTRVVCMKDGEGSNCDDMLLNGVEGTIVKMPTGCGPGQYAVVRSLEVSGNQSIPSQVLRTRDSSRPVMDLVFDYDFGHVKRADDKVYVRIDYSNVYRYWYNIFAADPVKEKRASDPELLPRFYSSNEDDWKNKFEKLTEVAENDLYYSEMSKSVDDSLYGSGRSCDNSEQFLKLDIKGDAGAKVKYGFTMVGTLDPWDIQESYSFLGADFDVDLELSCIAATGLSLSQTGRIVEELWQTPLRMQRLYHPGIVSIAPQFRVLASIETTSEAGLVGDFKTRFRGGSDGYMFTFFPEGGGDRTGQSKSKTSSDDFKGDYKITQGSLTFTLEPRVDLDIQIGRYHETSDGYASTITKRGWEADSNLASTRLSTWIEMGLGLDGHKAIYQQSEGYAQAMNYGGEHELFTEDDESQYLIGDRPKAVQLAGPTRDLEVPDEPDFSGYPVFGGHDLLSCVDGLDDEAGGIDEAVCVANIGTADPSLLEDGEEPSIPGSEMGNSNAENALDTRGNPRAYEVVDITTHVVLFTIYCLAYPSIGRLPWSPGDPRMDISNPSGCTEVGVTDDGDSNVNYVTEHIFELQSLAQFLGFAIHGQLPDGRQTNHTTIPQRVAEQLQDDYRSWAGSNAPDGNAMDHMFNFIGSNNNKDAMIPCEEQLNAVKGRLWTGNNIISEDSWHREDLDDPENIHMALSWLRDAANIFAYMEADPVQDRFQETVNSIRSELEQFEDLYNAHHSSQIDLLSLWDEWVISYFQDMRDRAAAWARRRGDALEGEWQDVVRSARRQYNADPNPQNQLSLEAAEENLKVIRETIQNILDRITNTSFWNWLT